MVDDPGGQVLKRAYVIAAWGGPRRVADPLYEMDRTAYLRHHLRMLTELNHSLDLIIVAVPRNDGQCRAFFDYVDHDLPDKIRGARIEVLWRGNNKGLAFGSFEDAFHAYRGEAGYWFFFEDDYVPMLHLFDDLMIERFHTSLDASFIAARLNDGTRRELHAVVSIGLTTREKIDALEEQAGGLVYYREEGTYRDHEVQKSQRLFSGSFRSVGRLYDMKGEYRIGLRLKSGSTSWQGPRNSPRLIGPIQTIGPWRAVKKEYPTEE